jgi:DNA-binding NarL/FixJ family response regulator
MSSLRIRVALIEDDPSTLERLTRALAMAADLDVVATFATGASALRWLESNAPDVLLTDLGLPDMTGMAVIAYCVQRHPGCSVMAITMFEDDAHVMASLEAGAKGYLLKDTFAQEVAIRVRELHAGGSPMTPVIARKVLNKLHPPRAAMPSECLLTERELTVLTRIAQGFSYAEVGEVEGITRSTVATHVRSVYAKLEVHSKNEAVFEATRLGLIRMPR